jgi:16S rRNA (guanine1516-N2)-methyltransferase
MLGSGEAIHVDSGSSGGGVQIAARDVVANAALLRALGIALDPRPPEEAFVLVERDGRLDLRPPGEAATDGIQAIFPPDRGRSTTGRNPLVRAFGRSIETIFDLTAGFGSDAYRLAEAGHRVYASERHPAIYAVLITGWTMDRASGRVSSEIAERLSFSHGDGEDMLARIDRPNIGVYLDPMYPQPRRSKALPRRELQVLRKLLSEKEDAVRLLEAARERAARVVVKRPHRAQPLVPGASFEVATKLVRFDVYINPNRMEDAAS